MNDSDNGQQQTEEEEKKFFGETKMGQTFEKKKHFRIKIDNY